jgi:hypothetical protein
MGVGEQKDQKIRKGEGAAETQRTQRGEGGAAETLRSPFLIF